MILFFFIHKFVILLQIFISFLNSFLNSYFIFLYFIPEMTSFNYQGDIVEKLKEWVEEPLVGVKGGILGLKMGLGKTKVMLDFVSDYLKSNEESAEKTTEKNTEKKKNIMVVCKKSNIQVWETEIKKFFDGKLSFTVFHKNYMSSSQFDDVSCGKIKLESDIIITTYEMVKSQFLTADPQCFISSGSIKRVSEVKDQTASKIIIVKHNGNVSNYTPVYSTKWDIIISDESHSFVGANTLSCNSMIALKSDIYFCLSGTPIVNYSFDLYSMFRFMGFYSPAKDWSKDMFVNLKLNTRIITLNYEEANVKLPDYKNIVIKVEFTDIEKNMYADLTAQLENCYKSFKEGATNFSKPLTMFTKLRQLCSCSYIFKNSNIFSNEEYNEKVNKMSILNECSKVKKALTIIKDIISSGEKVIIFSSFVPLLNIMNKLLSAMYKDDVVLQMDGSVDSADRNKFVTLFNSDPKYKIFLLTYKVGGVGINLTGSNNVILMEPWWNSAMEEQAISRAYRIGQVKNVTVYTLIASPSFEHYMIQIQNSKDKMIGEYIKEQKEGKKLTVTLIETILKK
jgi:SNF2 family DNA or RNA helicase